MSKPQKLTDELWDIAPLFIIRALGGSDADSWTRTLLDIRHIPTI